MTIPEQGVSDASRHFRTSSLDLTSLPEVGRTKSRGIDGYIYIIRFSTGVVKAGKSSNPRGRISAHLNDAQKFNAEIDQLWLSVRHRNYSENEKMLLTRMGDPSHGFEYFSGMSFEEVVETAESFLKYETMTESEREAELTAMDERSKARVSALFGDVDGVGTRICLRPDVQSWSLQMLFGLNEDLPLIVRDEADREAVLEQAEILCGITGLTMGEIQGWSFLDFLEHMAKSQVMTAIHQLHLRAHQSGRGDLLEPDFFMIGDAA
ncbi:hypothetical protein RQN9TF_10910 [Rhodococcus qingshengii]|uniref:GIY-YIG nuclease family protein n=1 Tax=Rhodococcus qingshengii TaxID=334542 RepID=UPI0021FB076C|nr:GIY-YIG nuclease family protein [Rhodococcus qingshengii]BDQ19714.1 hypothetical protein RQN9TF_10910 [Rhodococcus qingshengii]